MIKADFYLIYDIQNILNNRTKDEYLRPHYSDRVPAHTYFASKGDWI